MILFHSGIFQLLAWPPTDICIFKSVCTENLTLGVIDKGRSPAQRGGGLGRMWIRREAYWTKQTLHCLTSAVTSVTDARNRTGSIWCEKYLAASRYDTRTSFSYVSHMGFTQRVSVLVHCILHVILRTFFCNDMKEKSIKSSEWWCLTHAGVDR